MPKLSDPVELGTPGAAERSAPSPQRQVQLLQDHPPASWEILAMVFVPLGLSLLVDAIAGLALIYRRKLGLAPHNVARLMCGYIAATGVLWMLASAASGGLHFRDVGFVTLAMATGFFVRSMVSVAAPPLAIVNALVAAFATILFSRNPVISFAINSLAVTMVIYSTAVTQKAIAGEVIRFRLEGRLQEDGSRFKVPQMGWNQVIQTRPHPLWRGIPDASYFYFVHSYYARPSDPRHSAGETDYGGRFTSALAAGNIFATQFHPEKSAAHGLALYRNFLHWTP